jgi:hypothetical protein
VSVVGVWRIENDGNNKVLVVDGRQWKQGQTAAENADHAREAAQAMADVRRSPSMPLPPARPSYP